MARPYNPETSLRLHDEAMYQWMGNLKVDYPPDPRSTWTQRQNISILRVRTTPDRAFADTVNQLVSQGYFKTDSTPAEMRTQAASDFTVLPLPILTWQRGDPQPAPVLASACREAGRYIDPTTGKWVLVPWPGHYFTTYTLTFWCYKVYTDDYLREWILAQLGNRGAGNYETFIPVNHPAPWGMLNQSLKFQGMQDQSVLEGSDVRYKRFSATFVLRTWIMKNLPDGVDNVEKTLVTADTLSNNPGDGTVLDLPLGEDTTSLFTENLFNKNPISPAKIPSLWPYTGNASVGVGTISPKQPPGVTQRNTLLFVVKDSTDIADFGEWATFQDGNGLSIFSVSFDFTGILASVNFIAGQRISTSLIRTSVFNVTIPLIRQWQPVHQFLLFNQPIGSISIAGNGAIGKIWLANINVKRIFTSAIPFAPNLLGSTSATWTELQNRPYLCIAVIASGHVSDVFSLDDDDTSPVNTRTQILSVGTAVGVVLLSQPLNGSLKLRWPETTTLANVCLQPYDAGYHNSVV